MPINWFSYGNIEPAGDGIGRPQRDRAKQRAKRKAARRARR